jgi:hypothetical protein
MTAACLPQFLEKPVVLFLGRNAGGAGIEDVSAHHEYVHRVCTHQVKEPAQHGLVFGVAAAAIEPVPQVPIRSMENAKCHRIGLPPPKRGKASD